MVQDCVSAPISRRSALKAAAGLAAPLIASAQNRRPNVLFVIADDWGYGHAGAYGCDWISTPGFDRVARQGVLFTNAFTSNPKCSPCRATILTGRNTWQLKEAINHYSVFPKDFPVYPDLLEKAGYFVGMTGKGWGPGDYTATGWPHNPAGKEFQQRKLKPPTGSVANDDYSGNFQDFYSQKPKDRPFCFWLGGREPHRPYDAGSGLRAGKKLESVKLPAYFPDHRIVRSDMLDYALEVEWFDRHLNLTLDHLAASGELDNTLVIAASDHGMPFPRVKGQIYEDAFHIPMAACWGNRLKGGRTITDFINARDVAPTILEAAGVAAPGTVTGSSFLPLLTSDKSGKIDPSRSVMLVGKERHDLGRPDDAGYPVRAIRTEEYFYVRNYEPDRWPAGNPETGYRNVDDGPTKEFMLSRFDEFYQMAFGKRPVEELYSVKEDPQNMKNLARDPKYAMIKRQLRERMEEQLRSEGDPRALGHAEFFDTIEYLGPRAHSYAEWLKRSSAPR